MKTVSTATWILGSLLALAFILDLSGLTAWMPNGGSFFLGSGFVIAFLIGGSALLRFGVVRRRFRRLWAWVTLILFYFAFFVVRAVVFNDENYQPSLLFLLCLIAAFRILRAEDRRRDPEVAAIEGSDDEPDSHPLEAIQSAESAISAAPGRMEGEPELAVSTTSRSPRLNPRYGRIWPLVVLGLLAVAAILFEIQLPRASLKPSNFGILLGGLVAGGSIRFLYSGCRHFEGSRFGPGIAALVRGVVGIGLILLIQSVRESGLDIGEILSLDEADATLGFAIAGLAGFAMASWLGEPSLGKTTNRLLLIGASLGLGILFLGLWLEQIDRAKPAPAPQSTSVRWNIESIEGRDYVSDQNVHEFYAFESLENDDGTRVFRHPNLVMAWDVGRPAIFVNTVEISLQHPIIERQGLAYLATVDLAKLVEPIIRPHHIGTKAEFDTVVISLGGRSGSPDSARTTFLDDLATRLTSEFVTRGIAVEFVDSSPASSETGRSIRAKATDRQPVYLDLRLVEADLGSPASLSTYALVTPDSASHAATSRPAMRDLESVTLAVAIHSHVMGKVTAGKKRLARLEEKTVMGIHAPTVRVVIESSKLSRDTPAEQKVELARELAKAVAEGGIRWQSAL